MLFISPGDLPDPRVEPVNDSVVKNLSTDAGDAGSSPETGRSLDKEISYTPIKIFLKSEERGSEKVDNLPKITQLLSDTI